MDADPPRPAFQRLTVDSCLRVDSGGRLSGLLLSEDLVDEVSVLVFPTVVGEAGSLSIYNLPEAAPSGDVVSLALRGVEVPRDDAVWLRYDVVRWRPVPLSDAPAYADRMSSNPSTGGGVLALTFDDGPSEWTPQILDLLAEHGASATFFILGAAIAGAERTLERALAEGHELGLHSWSHPHLTQLSDDEIRREMSETQAAIERATSFVARVWRPPYFEADDRVRQALAGGGRIEAGCSIAPEDYHWPAERTAAFAIERLRPGAIVDLHDGRPSRSSSAAERSATVEALELILEEMGQRNLRGVSFSQLPTLEIGAAT